jgi:hypothetical protein
MTNRTFWFKVAIVLLLAQSSVVSRLLHATPYQQNAKGNPAEQDKLLSGQPFSLAQILGLLDVHPDRLSKAIQNRGLSFEATPENLESLKKAGASDKLIDLIRHRAPPKQVVSVAPTPAPSGNLVLKCSPAECTISIDGRPRGSTKRGTLEIKGLRQKEVVVDFEKDGYIGQQKTIAIIDGKDVSGAAELEATEATKEQFGADLLSMTIQALGGDAGLKDLASLSASGAAVVWNKDGQRSDWTLNTLLKLPDMALFDLQGSVANFWLSLVGDKYKSGGDRKKLGELLGAGSTDKNRSPGGGEFDSSLRIFRDFQVSALVARMRSSGFRASAISREADDKGESHLRAAGNAEVYEVTLDNDKFPTRMMYESELGLGTGMEIVYSNYKDVGKGKYPLTMVIKLPDAPHHGMEVRFENAMLSADLKEKDFNGRFKPKK